MSQMIFLSPRCNWIYPSKAKSIRPFFGPSRKTSEQEPRAERGGAHHRR